MGRYFAGGFICSSRTGTLAVSCTRYINTTEREGREKGIKLLPRWHVTESFATAEFPASILFAVLLFITDSLHLLLAHFHHSAGCFSFFFLSQLRSHPRRCRSPENISNERCGNKNTSVFLNPFAPKKRNRLCHSNRGCGEFPKE